MLLISFLRSYFTLYTVKTVLVVYNEENIPFQALFAAAKCNLQSNLGLPRTGLSKERCARRACPRARRTTM